MRPDAHIRGEHAIDIFKSKLPRRWIFREQTARDYGVDVEIELVDTAGNLSGEVIKAQVKGHQHIRFSRGIYRERVKASTATYWMRLRMPIILVSVDLDSGDAYWTDVATALRQQPIESLLKARVAIPVRQDSAFGPAVSLARLIGKALHDYDWRATADRFEAALDRMPELLRFAAWLDRCDSWMPLEREETWRLRGYHKMVRTIAEAVGIGSSMVHSLQSWKKAATQRGFEDKYGLPYEFGAAACWEILPLYFQSLIAHQRSITETERSFWLHVDEARFDRWFEEDFPDPGSIDNIKQLAFEYEARGY